jgi:hypothetical protein
VSAGGGECQGWLQASSGCQCMLVAPKHTVSHLLCESLSACKFADSICNTQNTWLTSGHCYPCPSPPLHQAL